MSAIRRQGGFTLLEIMIALTIVVMLSVLLGKVTVDGFTHYQYLQYQANGSADLSNILIRVSKVIRGATSVDTAQANTLTVYGFFVPQDVTADKIRYFVSGTSLKVGVIRPTGTAPNYTYPAANEVVTTISNNSTTSPLPIFTYYDEAGNQLAVGFSAAQVKQVGIYLSTNPSPHYLHINLSTGTRVTLRNAKTNL